MRINRNKRTKNSGFTLLELLLVMAILVVLASLSTFAILSLQSNALQKAAFMDITNMTDACKMYKLQVGSFPQKLDDLHVNPNGLSRTQWGGPYLDKPVAADPWQRPYVYTPNDANNTVDIRSAGPDGQNGTEDDVPDPGNQ